MKFDVFISYSRQDKDIVQRLTRIFQNEGISYCIDVDSICSGDQFASIIYDNINDSGCVLFISSKNSNASEWVDGEIAVARDLDKRIIPFRLDDTLYSKKIAIYISALDAIDYYGNNEQAIESLVKSIKYNSINIVPSRMEREKWVYRKFFYFWFPILCLILICCVLIVFYLFGSKHNYRHENSAILSGQDSTNISRIDTIKVKQEGKRYFENSNIKEKTSGGGSETQDNHCCSDSYSIVGNRIQVKVDKVVYNLIKISGGVFRIGATEEQLSFSNEDEKPVTKINVSTYYIGETEVTEAFWDAVMGHFEPSGGADFPKTFVSYYDCLNFTDSLSAITGLTIKLPTEAQWEYAARGATGDNNAPFAGSSNFSEIGWCHNNSSSLQMVSQRAPNSLGLYDMCGNAAEWCRSWYGNYTSLNDTDPIGPLVGEEKVIRGGSFLSEEAGCRNSARDKMFPSDRANNVGFRIVCIL